jgi:hypothetical protein
MKMSNVKVQSSNEIQSPNVVTQGSASIRINPGSIELRDFGI